MEISYHEPSHNISNSDIGVMFSPLNITTTLAPCNNTSDINCTNTATTTISPPYELWLTVLLAGAAGITSFATTIGNLMVIISFIMEKSIRQPSNYLIASLAVTDVLIGSLSMPLYTLYLLKAYWPLGVTLCELWLSLDYTVCLVSQYTVFLITLDRFCSVKVPAKYRNWRTKQKIKVMIAATWIIPTAIFFTSIMGWKHFVPSGGTMDVNQCYAQFQTNRLFSAILVICYYWVTLVIMVGLYAGIYQVALGLQKKTREVKRRIQQASMLNGLVHTNYQSTAPRSNNLDQTGKVGDSHENGVDGKATRPDGFKSNIQVPTVTISKSESANDNLNLQSFHTEPDATSPIWKPRNDLPDTSIHWDAFSGKTKVSLEPKSSSDSLPDGKSLNLGLKANGHSIASRQVSVTSESSSMACSPRLLIKKRHRHKSADREEDTVSETSDSDPPPTKPRALLSLTSAISNFSNKSKRSSAQSNSSFNSKVKENSTSKAAKKSENRARKALRTITFILGAFVVCWTPYHAVVLIDSFCKKSSCVNNIFYQFSYWLCYMNSPINPFCYALANQQFKKSFIKIIKFEYIRNYFKRRY